MRCNRKIAFFAVTPHGKLVENLDITEVGQLRRREKFKAEIAKNSVRRILQNVNCQAFTLN